MKVTFWTLPYLEVTIRYAINFGSRETHQPEKGHQHFHPWNADSFSQKIHRAVNMLVHTLGWFAEILWIQVWELMLVTADVVPPDMMGNPEHGFDIFCYWFLHLWLFGNRWAFCRLGKRKEFLFVRVLLWTDPKSSPFYDTFHLCLKMDMISEIIHDSPLRSFLFSPCSNGRLRFLFYWYHRNSSTSPADHVRLCRKRK